MKLFSKKRVLLGVGAAMVLLGGLVSIPLFNFFHAHEHCMKQTAMALLMYAKDHQGKFPFHTNGFGDAILILAKEDSYNINLFTAPGDDGSQLRECLAARTDMPELDCTRAYIQGLTENENPEIALVFDRYPTRGSDHSRAPWKPLRREVCLLDGSMKIVEEKNWPEFRKRQIALLLAAGISPASAEQLYAPPRKLAR